MSVPLNDGIAFAAAKLVDDAGKREPTHDDISHVAKRSGTILGDLEGTGGKAKRVRAMLSWALETDLRAGSAFLESLISLVRARGGFREASPNYCGSDAIKDLSAQLAHAGWTLDADGQLHETSIAQGGTARIQDLRRLAQFLVDGRVMDPRVNHEGIDVLEAAARLVVSERLNPEHPPANAQSALMSAFGVLGLQLPGASLPAANPQHEIQRAWCSLGLAAIGLRQMNQGTSPWLPIVTPPQAPGLSRALGLVALLLLDALTAG